MPWIGSCSHPPAGSQLILNTLCLQGHFSASLSVLGSFPSLVSPSAPLPILPTTLEVKFCSFTDKSLQPGQLWVGAQSFGFLFVPSLHTNTYCGKYCCKIFAQEGRVQLLSCGRVFHLMFKTCFRDSPIKIQ